ncbi:hypothetical protein MACK_001110 [Theileria orientalis]|uniref:Uncharacterized protein n=1 Tax=Theileria orientalis TaxID=68886 RepID=A0A976ME12_THEOR|nr:hypothetical protein MACK_001110 [Theileria orientalis]
MNLPGKLIFLLLYLFTFNGRYLARLAGAAPGSAGSASSSTPEMGQTQKVLNDNPYNGNLNNSNSYGSYYIPAAPSVPPPASPQGPAPSSIYDQSFGMAPRIPGPPQFQSQQGGQISAVPVSQTSGATPLAAPAASSGQLSHYANFVPPPKPPPAVKLASDVHAQVYTQGQDDAKLVIFDVNDKRSTKYITYSLDTGTGEDVFIPNFPHSICKVTNGDTVVWTSTNQLYPEEVRVVNDENDEPKVRIFFPPQQGSTQAPAPDGSLNGKTTGSGQMTGVYEPDTYSAYLTTVEVDSKKNTNKIKYERDEQKRLERFTAKPPFKIQKVTKAGRQIWPHGQLNQPALKLVIRKTKEGKDRLKVFFFEDEDEDDEEEEEDQEFGFKPRPVSAGTEYPFTSPGLPSQTPAPAARAPQPQVQPQLPQMKPPQVQQLPQLKPIQPPQLQPAVPQPPQLQPTVPKPTPIQPQVQIPGQPQPFFPPVVQPAPTREPSIEQFGDLEPFESECFYEVDVDQIIGAHSPELAQAPSPQQLPQLAPQQLPQQLPQVRQQLPQQYPQHAQQQVQHAPQQLPQQSPQSAQQFPQTAQQLPQTAQQVPQHFHHYQPQLQQYQQQQYQQQQQYLQQQQYQQQAQQKQTQSQPQVQSPFQTPYPYGYPGQQMQPGQFAAYPYSAYPGLQFQYPGYPYTHQQGQMQAHPGYPGYGYPAYPGYSAYPGQQVQPGQQAQFPTLPAHLYPKAPVSELEESGLLDERFQDIVLLTRNPETNRSSVLHQNLYDRQDHGNNIIEYLIAEHAMCTSIKHANKTIWKHYPQEYGDSYPQKITHNMNSQKISIHFKEFIILYQRDSESKWNDTEYDLRLYTRDHKKRLLEMDSTQYNLAKVGDEKFEFKFDKGAYCYEVHIDDQIVWKTEEFDLRTPVTISYHEQLDEIAVGDDKRLLVYYKLDDGWPFYRTKYINGHRRPITGNRARDRGLPYTSSPGDDSDE